MPSSPNCAKAQTDGVVHMGLGHALTDEFVVEGGRIMTDNVRAAGARRASDMPKVEVLFVGGPPECPYGAHGVGEIGLVPAAPAVAGALYY